MSLIIEVHNILQHASTELLYYKLFFPLFFFIFINMQTFFLSWFKFAFSYISNNEPSLT